MISKSLTSLTIFAASSVLVLSACASGPAATSGAPGSSVSTPGAVAAAPTQMSDEQLCAQTPAPPQCEYVITPRNGVPFTLPNTHTVMTVTVTPYTPPGHYPSYGSVPGPLFDNSGKWVKIRSTVTSHEAVPVYIDSLVYGVTSADGQNWVPFSITDEANVKTASGLVQPGATGTNDSIYRAPAGDPGADLFTTIYPPWADGVSITDMPSWPMTVHLG